jgi:hypothetical protein
VKGIFSENPNESQMDSDRARNRIVSIDKADGPKVISTHPIRLSFSDTAGIGGTDPPKMSRNHSCSSLLVNLLLPSLQS